ncbi:MAG: hypothetical protein ACREP9_18180 [Candidatus Dormibacteraceae bacterium]
MKRDTKNSIVVFVAGVLVGGILLVLELSGVDWAGTGRKWFGLVLWTAGIFGLLAYGYGRKLRSAKPLSLFLVALALHLSVMVLYLRSVADFPNLFFLFFGPLEGGLVVVAMTLLTDIDYRLPGGTRLRHQKWPPPGWSRSRRTAQKRGGQAETQASAPRSDDRASERPH